MTSAQKHSLNPPDSLGRFSFSFSLFPAPFCRFAPRCGTCYVPVTAAQGHDLTLCTSAQRNITIMARLPSHVTPILLFFYLLHIFFAQAVGRCYYPNGRESQNDFPCDPKAEHSACCGSGLGNACLNNRLCRGPDGNIIRGSCTDQKWGTGECALYCLGNLTCALQPLLYPHHKLTLLHAYQAPPSAAPTSYPAPT